MFDNLKEKLGSFRKDAEEAAEENVEELDDDELEAADPAEADAAEAEVDTAGSEADEDASPVSEAPDTTRETADEDETLEPGSEPSATAEPTPAAEPEAESDAALAAEADETGRGLETDEPAPETDEPAPETDEPAPETDEPAPETDEPAPETDESATDADGADDEDAEGDESSTETQEDDAATGFGAKARSLVKGKFVIEEEDLEGPLHELEMALLSSDVEMGVAEEIRDNIRDQLVGETRTFTTSTGAVVEEALRDAIYDVISVGQFDFDERIAVEDKPVTIVFTGVNGVGKTTSIAKLSRYFEERGYSTVMANGDTYRAGANEQIQEHANALDTKLISHQQGGDPAAVLYDAVEYAEANDIDVILGDTAGRLHTNEGLMDQLEKIDRVVDPDMTLFVDEAVAGQDAVNRAREFNEAAAVDGAILTKADADSNGGAAISVAHVTGRPILFLGVGQGYDDIERFDPDEMVDRLLADED
ncbi:signal recognition particle-docking protein FtsY [Natronorubrum halophilum]|uniref:signal recognition particle-docking protein FtsY n=1 Tax=Natronorubrum halophilum TaxID=1702106 RepID=UPI000EF68C53|nr:signal recognition particle-docking protein FtsY [Natronorubrum halophilum]